MNEDTNDELSDIREIRINRSLPKPERIAAFIREIGNPYRFKCGKYTINTRFTADGLSLEDCLLRVVG